MFELVREPCPGMNLTVFIATFQGQDSFEFTVNRTQIENGRANLNLPPNTPLMDICTMGGVIFGGNNAGYSTTADIQLPSGEVEETNMLHYPTQISQLSLLQNVTLHLMHPVQYSSLDLELLRPLLHIPLSLLPYPLHHPVEFLLLPS